MQSKIAGGDNNPAGIIGSHGTNVAGFAGAVTNNSIGVASLGWNIKLLTYQPPVIDNDSRSGLAQKIKDAADAGAHVINLSFKTIKTGFTSCSLLKSNGTNSSALARIYYYYNQSYVLVEEAITYAIGKNAVVIASAGNVPEIYEGGALLPCESVPYPSYPALYENVIAVSGSQQNNNFVDGWNYGPFIDVNAPGRTDANTGLWSTDLNNSYTNNISGTSFSTPQVSALAALIKSLNSSLTPAQIKTILENSADKVGQYSYSNGRNDYFGYGRINAYAALKYSLENYGGTLTQTLTIPAGETWNFKPGITVSFAPDASLSVNGTLNAIGTSTSKITFDRIGTTGSWRGIIFNSGSSGTLDWGVIKNVQTNGGAAIVINGSSPTIQDCTIENNGSLTYGVYVMNNATPTLNNNTIRNNAYDAIVFDHAGGYLTNNKITASNGMASINCWDNANPTFSTSGGSTGLNLLQNGAYGIHADWYSTPSAGTSSNQSSNNKLLDATAYNATASGYSTIYAKYNYWSPFPPSRIGADAGSAVYYDNYLTTPPFSIEAPPNFKEKILLNKTLADINSNDDILLAADLKSKKRYDEAINLYKQILDKDIDEYSSSTALVELGHIYRETKEKELFNYIKSFTTKNKTTTKGISIDLVVNILKDEAQFDEARLLNEELLSSNFKKTRFAMKGNLNLFHIYYAQGNYNLAKDVLTELKAVVEWNIGINTADLLMNKIDQKVSSSDRLIKQVVTNSLSPDFYLEQNYPNPFNPSTTIRYNIPKAGFVKISVYDILGREIKVLVNEEKSPGVYEIIFDANSLASGIYFYTIKTAGFIQSRKMILIK